MWFVLFTLLWEKTPDLSHICSKKKSDLGHFSCSLNLILDLGIALDFAHVACCYTSTPCRLRFSSVKSYPWCNFVIDHHHHYFTPVGGVCPCVHVTISTISTKSHLQSLNSLDTYLTFGCGVELQLQWRLFWHQCLKTTYVYVQLTKELGIMTVAKEEVVQWRRCYTATTFA